MDRRASSRCNAPGGGGVFFLCRGGSSTVRQGRSGCGGRAASRRRSRRAARLPTQVGRNAERVGLAPVERGDCRRASPSARGGRTDSEGRGEQAAVMIAAAHGAAASGSRSGSAHHRHASSLDGALEEAAAELPSSESIVKTAGIACCAPSGRTPGGRRCCRRRPGGRPRAGNVRGVGEPEGMPVSVEAARAWGTRLWASRTAPSAGRGRRSCTAAVSGWFGRRCRVEDRHVPGAAAYSASAARPFGRPRRPSGSAPAERGLVVAVDAVVAGEEVGFGRVRRRRLRGMTVSACRFRVRISSSRSVAEPVEMLIGFLLAYAGAFDLDLEAGRSRLPGPRNG